MRSKLSLIPIFIILLVPVNSMAYLEDYSPFSSIKPKPFPLKKLTVIEKDNAHVTFGIVRNGRNIALLKLFESQESDTYFFLLSIYDASGKLIRDSITVSDSSFWRDAYVADLNRDGKDDYVIQINFGATGLGTYKNFIVFALSFAESYEVITLNNWDSGSILGDFVDLNRNGHCQFIHTSFTYTEDQKGQAHSHWVYNLLEIKGTKLILANQLSPMFPKWVWYTNKPNHKASPFVNKADALEWSKSKFQSFFWRAGKENGDD